MVGEALGRTEMGRDLLAQDYLLKQLSASLLSPDEPNGQGLLAAGLPAGAGPVWDHPGAGRYL